MEIADTTTLLTGGASGLGQATARRLVDAGGRVVIADLPTSSGPEVAKELGAAATFVAADVTDADQVEAALDAVEEVGELRAVVHTAGSGRAQRLVDRDGNPASLEWFTQVVNLNLIGSFNVLRLAAARMARLEPIGEERGVVVMTASIAAFDGQIGQASYSSSKAGVVGLTLVAARDLASRRIRVCTIAPGLFDTPLLGRMEEAKKAALGAQVPNPPRLGQPDEYARLAVQIVENPMLNGETIRLDGALRMAPR
ncbi:SDR family NAD(P)-dependent oxidoreductase [Pseudonocardia nigra]|uniref:SDR family NAD(P)-dependent oxidoreductase n=1 Tax=Pseudonocardia nigra TaxID=1921578 RepID=UPI001C5E0D30|nr:SDR family NAD(P)-dependent oxidoreductase [Pseudonocardia nigra]